MKRLLPRSAKTIAVSIAAFTAVVATVFLLCDYLDGLTAATRLAARLKLAEEMARSNPAATTVFEDEVVRQTVMSLNRVRRQRTAGIIALSAAGACLALLKIAKKDRPTQIEGVHRHVAPVSPSQAVSSFRGDRPATSSKPVDLAPVEAIVARAGRQQKHLLPLLLAVNEQYHYLPPPALSRLTELTDIGPAQIAEIVSFYSRLRTVPRGKHLVQVCCGTACHVSGSDRILAETRRVLHIPPGEDTDREGKATVEIVGCLGCCTLAPVMRLDERIVGHVDVKTLASTVDQMFESPPASLTAGLLNGYENGCTMLSPRSPIEIRVGLGSCCIAGGSERVLETLRQEIARRRLHAQVKPVGCVGVCHLTPMVEVIRPGFESIVATHVTPSDVRRIVRSVCDLIPESRAWKRREIDFVQRTEILNQSSECRIHCSTSTAFRRFLDPQVRIVTEHSGAMNPTSLEEYQLHDGFAAFKRVIADKDPTAVIDSIEQSGLRGRGGAGYPTAAKWKKMFAATGPKYLVCNGDEGDPGAFMDRMIMESYPFRVLEGMAIAAYAVGANRAFVYVRHEYPLAVERLRHAIRCMKDEHLLGEHIFGTDFSLDVELVEGGGAFVCGEETALIQSMMGRRGTPQLRPPYPVERGLFDRPTLVNNVETLTNVPWIIRNGPERFAALGTQSSTGTKVLSLAGKVRKGGLIEVPMGTTIREIVESIGGGVADGKQFKAVQIGGPSGGCIPAELANTPIDYESLGEIGAIMGSGGLIVLDNDDCMVDVARYFIEFTTRESCGHCTFCRLGTRKLLDLLERICHGKGRHGDLNEIENLCRSVSAGSLCGLGKTAPNPVLTTLKYFRHEYEAHLKGRCPAGRCKALIRYEVNRDCTGCTLCAQHCPEGAIPVTPYKQHRIDAKLCSRCDICRAACPESAIRVLS